MTTFSLFCEIINKHEFSFFGYIVKKRTKYRFFSVFSTKKPVQIFAICEIMVYYCRELELFFWRTYGIYLKRTAFGYVLENATNP